MLPISIQQKLMSSNKEDASPDEIRAFLHRRQQYKQFTQKTMPQPFNEAATMEKWWKQHNQQMPDRQKDLKESASIVISLVTSKRKAARKHLTLKTERSKPETDNKHQETALSITEN